jgi:hypothetical protein
MREAKLLRLPVCEIRAARPSRGVEFAGSFARRLL